jgi:alpha-D-ribose 1-methylphosphonate 5-triphosphate synthase subunit PhnG
MSNEQYLTTAAQAEFEASTAKLAHEVEVNADKERTAAQEAAAAAQVRIFNLIRRKTSYLI